MTIYQKGFTLLELLITIAIIGILSSITITNLFGFTERARIAQVLNNVREMEKAIRFYILDTNQNPPLCIVSCNETNDPLLNSLGVPGWNGPYVTDGIHYRLHPWGGHLGVVENGGQIYIVINDDSPEANDNAGRVPTEILIDMDNLLDDGDLSQGNFVGDGQATIGGIGVVGEAVYRVTPP